MTISAFIQELRHYQGEQTFNPWADYDPACDIGPAAPQIRCRQLEEYLTLRLARAKYIFIAEAAGYQGCRFTGIAITCERMLLDKHKQVTSQMVLGHRGIRTSRPDCSFMTSNPQRLTGMNEPTDTYVWGSILDNGLSPADVLLWNIFPFHPHKASPFSNRTPTDSELMAGLSYTRHLLGLCSTPPSIGTIGKKAYATLGQAGYNVSLMRHPANGGAGKFREQFRSWIGAKEHA